MTERTHAIRARCPHCNRVLNLQPKLRGKRIRCPECQNVVSVKRNPSQRRKSSRREDATTDLLDWEELAIMNERSSPVSEVDFLPPAQNIPRRSQSGRTHRPTRPVGVSLLAVLHIVGGVGLAVVLLIGLAYLGNTSQSRNRDGLLQVLNSNGISPALLLFGILFLLGIALASGIGLMLGSRWGWRVAIFYYTYSISRNLNALVFFAGATEALQNSSRGPAYYFAKHFARVAISILVLCYLMKPKVCDYFGVNESQKGRMIGILIGTGITVFALSFLS